MAKRKESETAVFTLRIKEPIRRALEAAAKRRGVSLNNEIIERLERTLAESDAFGGPEIHNMARLMAAAFQRGGQAGAAAYGHPEWTPAEWMNQPLAYSAAVEAVRDALALAEPRKIELHPAERSAREIFGRMVARGNSSIKFGSEEPDKK